MTTTPPASSPALPGAEPVGAGEAGTVTSPPDTSRPVVMAAVTGAHGIGGDVKLKVFADDLAAHRSFNGGALTLAALRNGTIARFAEVADRTAAEALRGTELTVRREALPPLGEGEYYHVDLSGLPVSLTTGDPVGRIVSVDNFGAGDLIEIERPDGRRFMVPMRSQAVPEWDADRLVIHPDFVE